MNAKSLIFLAILVLVIVGGYFLYVSEPARALSEEEAISALLLEYPELALYQTTDLPPSAIESEQSDEGWYIGFIRRGSGIPGILDAKCYFVDNDKNISVIGEYKRTDSVAADSIELETCKPILAPTPPIVVDIPKGTHTLKLGELGVFDTISIRPVSIEEDSRCPVDVTCIQAGTVRLLIEIISKSGTSTSIIKLGQAFTTQGVAITLTDVAPVKNSTVTVADGDYRFTIKVAKQGAPVVTEPEAACYKGGCSGQLCTDRQDMVSTCEYREEYACYQSAVCKRQPNGQCGWTDTPALRACLGT